MDTLRGKVVVVTGASSGIGRAAARLFAKEGARVVVAARRQVELETLVQEIVEAGDDAVAVAGDVGEPQFAAAVVQCALTRFGGLDVAFNNAGTMGPVGATANVPTAAWDETIRTNLSSAFFAAQHQIPALAARGGGSLIFTSSFVGHTAAFPGVAAYAASKAGLIGLTQALAVELADKGIRVNALLPGGTDTPMGRQFASTPETLAFVRGPHAMKRLASPDEIARSALYLASDASSFCTGAALPVDGGVSVNRT